MSPVCDIAVASYIPTSHDGQALCSFSKRQLYAAFALKRKGHGIAPYNSISV
jgi:hypothetical protein